MSNTYYPHTDTVYRKDEQDFDTWLAILSNNGKEHVANSLARMLYREGWDATACRAFCRDNSYFDKEPSGRPQRRVLLNETFVEARIAQAIIRECGRLFARNLSSAAREANGRFMDRAQQVLDRIAAAERAAAIEPDRAGD